MEGGCIVIGGMVVKGENDLAAAVDGGSGLYENRQQHIVAACLLMDNFDILAGAMIRNGKQRLELKEQISLHFLPGNH